MDPIKVIDALSAGVDKLKARVDAHIARRDEWSDEARKAAAEARRKGGGGERKRSGFGTKSMRELDDKHQKALRPLLEARDREKRNSPEWAKAQKAIYDLQDKQNAEMLALQSKIERGESK